MEPKLTRNPEVRLFHTCVQQQDLDMRRRGCNVGHLHDSVRAGASQTPGFILMQPKSDPNIQKLRERERERARERVKQSPHLCS